MTALRALLLGWADMLRPRIFGLVLLGIAALNVAGAVLGLSVRVSRRATASAISSCTAKISARSRSYRSDQSR